MTHFTARRFLATVAAGFTFALTAAQANEDVYIFHNAPDSQTLNAALFGGTAPEAASADDAAFGNEMFRTRGIRVKNAAQPAYAPAGRADGYGASAASGFGTGGAVSAGGTIAPAAKGVTVARKAPVASAAPAAAPAKPAAQAKPEGGATVAYLIKFEFNSARIDPSFHGHLDKLAGALQMPNAQDKVLRIMGHTDSVGSAEYNERLSIARAEAVRDYLVRSHGIPAHRLAVLGFGEAQPLAERAATDPLNRRVEFKAI